MPIIVTSSIVNLRPMPAREKKICFCWDQTRAACAESYRVFHYSSRPNRAVTILEDGTARIIGSYNLWKVLYNDNSLVKVPFYHSNVAGLEPGLLLLQASMLSMMLLIALRPKT